MKNIAEQFLSHVGTDKNAITKQAGTFSLAIYGTFFPGAFSSYMGELYNFDFGAFAFAGKDNYGVLFFDLEAYEKTTEEGWKRFKESSGLDTFIDYQKYQVYKKEISDLYDEVFDKLKDYSEEDLIHRLKLTSDYLSKLLVASVFCEAYQEEHLARFYKGLDSVSTKLEDFSKMAMTPGFNSFAVEFNRLVARDNVLEKDIAWIFTDYYSAPLKEGLPLKIKSYIEEKGGMEKVKIMIRESDAVLEESKSMLQQYRGNLTDDEKKLFDFTQCAMELRDRRKEPLQQVMTAQCYLVQEYLKQRSIPIELAPFCVCYDFINGECRHENFEQELRKRREGFLLYADGGTHYMETDLAIIKEEQDTLLKVIAEQHPESSELKGNIGCKGFVVSGIIKVIHSQTDFGNFNDGDILVTSMTRPEFVPLMKKASAVITDEGGVTCHAAIVSRELGVPCIIGTKIATQFFKDGDLVEVDANKGIVKKI